MKIGCVIQGDLRRGSELVLGEMVKQFDVVILSTWSDEKSKIPLGDFITVLNEKPLNSGSVHRNFQRYSTARGLEKAKELDCDFVLKWRTDMLPLNLDKQRLVEYAIYDLPDGVTSRIVTLAFRNLTVEPDWYSSIPDLFHFGHIDIMQLLWGDENLDYNEQINLPTKMILDVGTDWMNSEAYQKVGIWAAESELYAFFRERLENKLGLELNHRDIVKNYMRLVNHRNLEILWFDKEKGFRSIFQAWQFPWWTEKIWLNGEPKRIGMGYPWNFPEGYLKKKLTSWITRYEKLRQELLYCFKFKGKI